MQQILEFIPLVVFFWAYFAEITLQFFQWEVELGNIYGATTLLIAATIMQLILCKLLVGKLEKRNWITALVILVFGGLTLVLRNNLFIQWKPTIANWCFALIFIFGPYFTQGEPIMKKILSKQFTLPDIAWKRLTLFMIASSIFLGALNLVVVYNFSEEFWVKFKLYSAIISSIISTIVILFIVSPYLSQQQDK
jgi:intracellular septation protein